MSLRQDGGAPQRCQHVLSLPLQPGESGSITCVALLDKLTHADAGQMHLYCNYARAHWTLPDENPPVGLILCTGKGAALARYALEGLPNKIMGRQSI